MQVPVDLSGHGASSSSSSSSSTVFESDSSPTWQDSRSANGMCGYMCVCMWMYVCMCLYMCVRVCMYVCVSVYVCVYVCVWKTSLTPSQHGQYITAVLQ